MEKIKFDFKSRTAIVTGGAQGFGFDITKRFLKSGAKVIMWDNDPKAIDLAIKEIDSPNLSSHVVDVSNYEEVDKIVSDAIAKIKSDISFNHKREKVLDVPLSITEPVLGGSVSASAVRQRKDKL